jgi:hypothetical protein
MLKAGSKLRRCGGLIRGLGGGGVGIAATKKVVVDVYIDLSTDANVGVGILAVAEEVKGVNHGAIERILKGNNAKSHI